MSWLSKLGVRAKSDAAPTTVAKARFAGPPHILIDRHEYQPAEMVLGSFRIRPYEGDLIARQQFDFRIAFTLDGEPVEFPCRGMVVKLDETAGLVARYQPPQPFYERKLIEYMRQWKGV